MANFLAHKVPLWVALVIAGVLVYYITRPAPEPVTVIEYVDRQVPPKPRVPAQPDRIVIYDPVLEFRVDQVLVPIEIERYHLVDRTMIGRNRQGGITVAAFDPDLGRFEQWVFNPQAQRWQASLSTGLSKDILGQAYGLDVRPELKYKRLSAFADLRLDQHLQVQVHVGVRFYLFDRRW